ncbi:DNA primase [Macrococcoides caseolyticum]|uniref:DNA primase n=1 Tax=Macrococcoides caseolyticum TaxID=69966 RepID=UPI001F27E059|nr:DNA primase [Macrococcus caseolyticus]MCE4956140.1 DNA primase [Macrococcus caseolyticus]
MQIDPKIINEIREKNDILDVVSQYVKLEKRGRNYIGLCPFHDEKRPSFSVSVEKQICHCFGCKKGGNVFQFIEQIENVSFIEAVKILGANVDITVDIANDTPVVQNEQTTMIEMHNLLQDYYHYVLKAIEEAEPALAYLRERGLTDEMIAKEKIGFSPNVSHFALDFLKKRGYDEALAYEAGLLSRNDENFSYFDRFRNRIMFPIHNARGDTVGFSARSYDGSEPKYLNSPETPVFQKRNILYHIDVARKPIRDADEVILLEGFMDVLKLSEIGIHNAIATMGTALSREHVLSLKKLAANITLMYDGDRAGIEATLKVGQTLLTEGLNVFVVPMHKGKDPDEMIRDIGHTAFLEYQQTNKMNYLSFYMKHFESEIINNDLAYEKHLNQIIQDAKLMNSDVLQKKVLHEASELFKVDFDSLKYQVQKHQKKRPVNHFNVGIKQETFTKIETAERVVLKHFMTDKYLFEQFKENIPTHHFSNVYHRVIYEALFGYYKDEDHFNLSQFLQLIPQEMHEICLSIDDLLVNSEPTTDEINDYVYVFNEEQHELTHLNQLKQELKEAIAIGNLEKRDEIARAIIQYQRNKRH